MGEGTSCLRGKKQQQWVRKFLPKCRLSQKVCLSVKFCKYKWEFIIIPLPPKKIPRYCWKTTVSQTLRTSCWDSAFCMFIQVWRKKKKTLTRTLTQFLPPPSFTPTINLTHLREASKIPCFWTTNVWMEKGRMMKFWKGSYELIFLLVEQIGNMILSLVFFVFFWMQNLIRSNGKPPVLFFAWKNEEVLPSSDKPAANTASMLQLLTSSLLFPN